MYFSEFAWVAVASASGRTAAGPVPLAQAASNDKQYSGARSERDAS